MFEFFFSFWVKTSAYFAEDDFRCQVLRCPTQCPSPAFYPLGKSEVCHLKAKYP